MGFFDKLFKSNQEQATACWVAYLNQVRMQRLAEAMQNQDINLKDAMDTLDQAFQVIQKDFIEGNRGGRSGKHGFIAEVAEVGIGNARRALEGKIKGFEWIDDNGPDDIIWDGVRIQMKFYNSGNHLSLQAIQKHLEQYPDYLKQGKRYMIPLDHYEKIKELLAMPADVANKKSTQTEDFSLKQWKEVHEFFEKGDIPLDKIEPSQLSYDSVQVGKVADTFEQEEASIKFEDKAIRAEKAEAYKPSVEEAAKVAAFSAALEGVSVFVIEVRKKQSAGKRIKDFNSTDWEDILKKSGIGVVKGGVRGGAIYGLTNMFNAPAAAANAVVTAGFGVAEQAYLHRNGRISDIEFLQNAELVCVDSAVSMLSAMLGQAIIPVPVLGAVIGNTVGNILYQTAKDGLARQEMEILEGYVNEIGELYERLDEEYQQYVIRLCDDLQQYYNLLNMAFYPNPSIALEGSIAFAKYMGVPDELILTNIDKIDDYFLN